MNSNTFDTRLENFKTLVQNKFGTERGFKSTAARALRVNQPNFSAMYNGTLTIPDRHFDTLTNLPDYTPPEPEPVVHASIPHENGLQRIRADLDEETYGMLQDICTYVGMFPNTDTPDMNTPEDMNKLISVIIYEFHLQRNVSECLEQENPLS